MSGSKRRKPLIKAKHLEWVNDSANGEIQFCDPALRIRISTAFGSLKITTNNGFDAFVLESKVFTGKGKTERAKAYAQKWWNRFVRSLRSGLEVKVE